MNRAEFKNNNYPGFVGHVCDVLEEREGMVRVRFLTGDGSALDKKKDILWFPKSDLGPITTRNCPRNLMPPQPLKYARCIYTPTGQVGEIISTYLLADDGNPYQVGIRLDSGEYVQDLFLNVEFIK